MSEVARPFPKKQFKKPLVYFYEKKKSNPQKSLINFKPYIRIWDRFHKPVLISGFLILLLSAILYVILFSGFFRIKSVKILGAEKFVNANDVIRISVQNTQDQNLLLFDTPGLQANLTRVFHGAKNFSVGKKYPDTLIVYVQERKPIALVHNTNSLEYYLVDEDGFVLGTIEETESNLPKVVYEGELKIGSAINKDLIPAYLELFQSFNEQNVKFSSMSFYPSYVYIGLEDGVSVYIGSDKKKRESVEVVSDLLKQLKLEGKPFKKIDLRYDKVIVEY